MAVTVGSIGTTFPEALGKKLDTTVVSTTEGSVHREGMFAGDPEDPAARANVRNAAPGASDYGNVVRSPDGGIVPLGAAADAETVNTQIGLLKRIVSRLVGNLSGPATWQAVPTSAADLIASTVTVLRMHFSNTTGAAVTLTVNDKSGAPLGILTAFSVPANSFLTVPFDGVIFTGGIRWVAGGAGVNGAVVAFQ